MEDVQGLINIIFFIIIYIPVNIFLMAVAAVVFNVANRLLGLHFPSWVIAVAAGLLVFLCMFSFLDGVSHKRGWISFGSTPSGFYFASFVINAIIVILMITMSGINKLIFKNAGNTSFSFEKPQIIATVIYAAIAIFLAITPLLREGNDYIADMQDEARLKALQKTIDENNLQDFEKAYENNSSLWKVKLADDNQTLFDYLVAEDKVDLAKVLLKKDKNLFGYTFDWDIKSSGMTHSLIAEGMSPVQAVELLTKHNQSALAKETVEKYKPTFDTLVSYITQNVLKQNDTNLLDYLIDKGLAKDAKQTSETIVRYVELGELNTIKMLVGKGYKIDTSYNNMIYWAVYHHNLPMLKYLFQFPFNVNAFNDEYTNVENAIIGNDEAIFDYLLTLKPDITTIHTTKLNGETNALLIAERYKQPSMLEKLKRRV